MFAHRGEPSMVEVLTCRLTSTKAADASIVVSPIRALRNAR
jgi:hypothetical protein